MQHENQEALKQTNKKKGWESFFSFVTYEGLRVMLGFLNELSWIFIPFKPEKKFISWTRLN